MHEFRLQDVSITSGFWRSRQDMVAAELLPYQWKALNDQIPGTELSHAVENFRIAAGEEKGEFYGTIFQDSDVAKWIEAASYSLLYAPDSELEGKIDELVRLMGKAQRPDGYLNTYFIVKAPEKRWTDLKMGHELYCAGHLMEAAVAYASATGKKEFLCIMSRYADYIASVFGPGENQRHGFGGHPEIELALYRLAEITGKEKYRDLANYFLDQRGTNPDFCKTETAIPEMNWSTRWFRNDYYLAHAPVLQQRSAEGHSVRAMYLFCALTDRYRFTPTPELQKTLRALWENTVSHRMYITGGIGSQGHGERFTFDYDLPNDRAYTETCASIGLALWSWRMLMAHPRGEYADILEKVLYNGALSGLALDGKSYFYVNPLEVYPRTAQYREDYQHVKTHRVPWFGCACCPPNIARTIASAGRYIATQDENVIWIHQFIPGEIHALVNGQDVTVKLRTNYPWDGRIKLEIESEKEIHLILKLRIPGWCKNYRLTRNHAPVPNQSPAEGYITINTAWKSGDQTELLLDMPVRFITANTSVRDDVGRVALQRGPLIYCLEEIDNGNNLHLAAVNPATAKPQLEHIDSGLSEGTVAIRFSGFRFPDSEEGTALYQEWNSEKMSPESCTLRAIPYFEWGNRAQDQEMLVWIRSIGPQG